LPVKHLNLSATELEPLAEIFRRLAADFEKGGSPLYARLAREHADDPILEEICGDHRPRWEVPLRLFGGVHYLVLSGRVPDAWSSFPATLRTHQAWLSRFVVEQPVQTNEVQRCWGLLPAFLAVSDGRPIDLVELGPSGGLNLLWDRYAYLYDGLRWGPDDAQLELAGEVLGALPSEHLRRDAVVRSRVGIDRHPVDLTTEEGALLLQSFVWADQDERLARLRRAIDVLRRDPPRLVEGDYVEELPRILAHRDLSGLTLIYHSASLSYLRRDVRERVRAAIAAEGRRGSLAYVSYEFDEDARESYEGFTLDARVYPGGETRRLARLDGHGNRLRWLDG
jgi:hypothetical protein